jgi:HAE1 family hydrophobic/amphiphilic exporter-1
MASQFESFLHPFLILFTVPMACAGSIYGLVLTGTNVSVVVFIGLIMLAGIVVNNAIVLIDRINQLRESGVEKGEAIIEAAQSRLRPILMTTLTTVLGLLPMAIGLGEGSEIRTPMAVTVIFGLLFASLLTLFLIPVLYSLFDRKQFKSIEVSSPVSNSALGNASEEPSHG